MNAQERDEFLEKIKALCHEHCVAYCFQAEVECDEYVEGANETMMIGFWEGGLTMCTGLAHRALKQIQQTPPIEIDEDKE